MVRWREKGATMQAMLALERESMREVKAEMVSTKVQTEGFMRVLGNVVTAREQAWKEGEASHAAAVQALERGFVTERERHAAALAAKDAALAAKYEERARDAAKYEALLQEVRQGADVVEERLRAELAAEAAARETAGTAGLKASLKHAAEKAELEGGIQKTQDMVQQLLGKRDAALSERDAATAAAAALQTRVQELGASLSEAREQLKARSKDQVRDSDLRLRLKELTEKVHALETEHEQELVRLNGELAGVRLEGQVLQGAASSSAGLAARLADRNEQLELELSTAKRGGKGLADAQAAAANRIAGLEKALEKERERAENDAEGMRGDIQSLRRDRDEATELCRLGQKDNDTLAQRVVVVEKNLATAEGLLRSAREEAAAAAAASSEEVGVAAAMEDLEAAVAAKDEEIDGLKDTIRRECTERTEMLIEMSELRDRMQRGGAPSTMLRSQSQESYMPQEQQQQQRSPGGAADQNRLPNILEARQQQRDDEDELVRAEDDSWRKKVSSGKGLNRGGGRARGQGKPKGGTMR